MKPEQIEKLRRLFRNMAGPVVDGIETKSPLGMHYALEEIKRNVALLEQAFMEMNVCLELEAAE